jgi:hypothetical protein
LQLVTCHFSKLVATKESFFRLAHVGHIDQTIPRNIFENQ